jgi:alpha-glucosidase (family GH31 glycosyl hydrolase)
MLRPHSGEEQYCEPFAHGLEAEKISSFYLDWRYRFIPYVYSYAHQTTQASEQLIKPIFMLFNDAACDTVEYQYMFGDELMAAPVVEEGKRTKKVYFPELENNHKWIDFWNDKAYKGGEVKTVPASLSEFPLFARQPSIIPLGKVKKHTGSSADDTLFCRIYPGGEASFTLFEDDGESYEYENGAYSKTDIQTNYKQKTLSITVSASKGSYEGMLESRHWVFDIRLIRSFDEIKINGELLQESAYSFESQNDRLLISADADVTKEVVIEIKQANLTEL